MCKMDKTSGEQNSEGVLGKIAIKWLKTSLNHNQIQSGNGIAKKRQTVQQRAPLFLYSRLITQ